MKEMNQPLLWVRLLTEVVKPLLRGRVPVVDEVHLEVLKALDSAGLS